MILRLLDVSLDQQLHLGHLQHCKVCALLHELHGDCTFSYVTDTKVVGYDLRSLWDLSLLNNLHLGHLQGIQGVHPFA